MNFSVEEENLICIYVKCRESQRTAHASARLSSH